MKNRPSREKRAGRKPADPVGDGEGEGEPAEDGEDEEGLLAAGDRLENREHA